VELVNALGFGLLILIGLSLVVFLHEGGHFLAAQWAGVEVEAFAVGWGPVVWRRTWRGTEYRLCLLPAGGYCKMKGEQDLIAAMEKSERQVTGSAGSLFSAPAWKRIVISAAGPLVNLAVALLVFMALALSGVPSSGPDSRILLASEVDGRTGTPAQAAGLVTGDRVTAVNGRTVRSFAELQARITSEGQTPMTWSIDRNGLSIQKTVTAHLDPAAGRPLVGVYSFNEPVVRTVVPQTPAALAGFAPGDRITAVDGEPVAAEQIFLQKVLGPARPSWTVEVDRAGIRTNLILIVETAQADLGLRFVYPTYPAQGLPLPAALAAGWSQTFDLLGQMLTGLGRLFTGKEDPVQSLSGPIGIVGQGTTAVSTAFGFGLDFGAATLVRWLAFLNLALFLMNLLPIPALDGGSIVVSLVEGLRRKPLGLKALMAYQQAGAILVLGLLLFTTLNDLGLFGKT